MTAMQAAGAVIVGAFVLAGLAFFVAYRWPRAFETGAFLVVGLGLLGILGFGVALLIGVAS